MKKLRNNAFSFLLLFGLLACDTEDETTVDPVAKTETIQASLQWTGDYAADGCGYILNVGTSKYKPTNENDIPNSYKTQDPTLVQATIINYRKSTSVFCGFANTNMNSVKIVKLEKL